MRARRHSCGVFALAAWLCAGAVWAQPAPTATGSASAPSASAPGGACVAQVPKGATPPTLEAAFPTMGQSGHAAWLQVTVSHGAGETVLPDGFRLDRAADAPAVLSARSFFLPDPNGDARPRIERAEGDGPTARTVLHIAFVPLPKEPGRHELELPALPITVARANGDLMTVCTAPQRIVVEDPIASELDPQVRPNPPPRPQREDWPEARMAAYALLGVLLLGPLLGLLIARWLRRPRPEPEKPPVLPWLEAMAELQRIRASRLLEQGETDAYFDQVDHTVRWYLGARYGFDGVDSTTSEIQDRLRHVRPAVDRLDFINRFLDDNDLVKFTEASATAADCDDVMLRAEHVVMATTPQMREPGRAAKRRPPREAA